MRKPLLSIVVPVYGTEKFLTRCLNSLLEQSYARLEIIIVDDCSPDGSAEIIRRFCDCDLRITTVKHQQNRGLFQARLTGAAMATGEYVAFIDSDDYVSVDYYRELVAEAVRGGFDIVAGSTVREFADGTRSQYTLHNLCFGETPIFGDEVRHRFYGQEGTCYAWHTVWNKIYRKTLWDACVPEYKQINQHLIMTEDIAISSILFYRARSFSQVKGGNAYFYCVNENATTNAEQISFSKFQKNMEDMILVFNFVGDFLRRENAEDAVQEGFARFRWQYYCLWKNLQEKEFCIGEYGRQAKQLVDALGEGSSGETTGSENYFESAVSAWHGQVEEAKRTIAAVRTAVVSFDIFDTLLLRPLWDPADVFLLMQPDFERICPNFKTASFQKFRQAAERQIRGNLGNIHPGYEDVNLTEIYQQLGELLHLPAKALQVLQAREEELEYSLSQPRKIGKELFEFAKACGKRVILISDMYLEKRTIEAMLHKNGYDQYEQLFLSSDIRLTKFSGNLFSHAAMELHVKAEQILHIGDNWEHDIGLSRQKGFQAFFLPKSRDIFCNTFREVPTNHCASIGCMAGGVFSNQNKLFASLGYRSMMAMVANEVFDNPYVSWNPDTDFNADPEFTGYYAVGMALVGIAKWLSGLVVRRGIRNICFLGRDGYLPMQALERMQTYFGVEDVQCSYVPCSRMALLPWIIENREGLYSLPVEYRNHTPISVSKMLGCCIGQLSDKLAEQIQVGGFLPNKCFGTEKEFFTFLAWFRDHLFNGEALEASKTMTAGYYRSQIPAGSLVFDLGYSGNIPLALQKCLGYPVTFAYQHHDNNKFYDNCRRGGLDMEVLYSFVPPFSDLIREFFFSEYNNSCVGLRRGNERVEPVFERTALPYAEQFAFERIEAGAIRFVEKFVSNFQEVREVMCFEPTQVFLPLEGLIHSSMPTDRRMLAASFSDDTVYGRNDRINMSDFWCGQIGGGTARQSGNPDYYGMVQAMLYGRGKIEKLIIYAICDRRTLKEKVKIKLQNHSVILFVLRKVYGSLKMAKNVLKRK